MDLAAEPCFNQPEEVCKKINPKKYLKDHLSQGVRPKDNRRLFSYRSVVGNVNFIKNCCGSSIVKIGSTTVICGIKNEVTSPSKRFQNKGLLDIDCKLSDHCNVSLNHKNRVVLLKQCVSLLQKLFIGLKIVDLESLCIAKGELVWLLKADIVCLDYDGGFWDAAVMALHLALSSTKLPVIEYSPENERFVLQENTLVDLPVGKFPLATSFGVFQDFVFTDPSFEEEQLCSSFFVVVVQDNAVKITQKRGGYPISDVKLMECINVAASRYKIMEDVIRAILENR
ncbi:Exosome component 8 [Nesidiocoris tenuis]|uniref:Ribosomal RNA-processing protein 43 n=1 Tax=Nesidiocoris tenuis TaxID=355587 RepID=A0ABN7B951_9HEMI|nr:Exosome component 8 [Nesidiocoris tenuis]